MAYDIGPRIGIDGEKEYRAQINSIITQTKTLQAETKKVSAAYDENTSAQVKAANQTKTLNKEIDLQKSKLDTQRTMLAKAKESYGENSDQALKWQRVVAESEAELARLNAELRNTPTQLQAFGQDMQNAGKKVEAVGKAVTKVGTTLTKTVTAPIVALGTAAVKTTADFDSSMSKVKAVSGATGSQFNALRSKAREMGAQTKFSASEAADAMNYMAMAGWKTEEMLSGVEGIMNLAAASGEDLATTSDIVTDALTAFGKSAEDSGRLADIMAAASSNANTNVAMMGETFKYAAPVAGALGMSMEDTAIAIGMMANAGVKASAAGTAIRTGLTNLVKPTKQMREAMEKYGIEVTNADGSMKSMREITAILRSKLGRLGEAEQAAAAGAIFGKNAMSGWLAVINGSDEDLNKLTNAVDNSAGTAKRMAEVMQDNLSGQITILKSQVQELGISFGDILVPHVRKAVSMVQDAVDAFNSLDDSEREQIVKLAAIAAAAGPVITVGGKLISVTGSLITNGGALITTLAGAGTAAEAGAAGVGLLGGAMAALPVVAAVAGIAALAAIAIRLSRDANESKASLSTLGSEMGSISKSADATRSSLDRTIDGIQDLAEANENSIAKAEASANLAGRYADELDKLAKKSNRTTSEQAKMQAIVGKLNKIYPDLGLAIDETTGELNMSTDALKDNIEQMKIQMKLAAYQDYMTEQMKQLVEVETKVVEAETKKSEAIKKSAEAAQRQKDIEAAMAKEQEALNAAYSEYNEAVLKYGAYSAEAAEAQSKLYDAQTTANDGMITLNGTLYNTRQAMDDCANAQKAAVATMGELDQTIKDGEEAAGGLNQGIDTTSETIAKLSEEADKTIDSMTGASDAAGGLSTALAETGDAADGAADAIEDASEEIIKAWDKAYDSARDSVMGQGSIFDELSEKAEASIEQMRDNLEKQIESYRSWNDNATTLMESTEYATDENFRSMVNYIVSAGQSMAPELQAIVDAYRNGDESLNEITNDYGEMSKLADDVAQTTANATTAAEYGLEAMEAAFGNGTLASADAISTGNESIKAALDDGTSKIQLGVSESLIDYNKLHEGIEAAGGLASAAARDESNAVGAGMAEGQAAVAAAVNNLTTKAGELPTKVTSLTGSAKSSGQTLAGAAATGIKSQKGQVTSAAKTTGTEAKELTQAVTAQKAPATAAARDLGNSAAQAIESTKPQVSNMAKSVGTEARQVATAANAQKTTITTSGRGIGVAFAESINGTKPTVISAATAVGREGRNIAVESNAQKATVQGAGSALGQTYADGINSKTSNASSAGKNVANSGISGVNSVSTYPAKEWGHHLGQNLADGIWDKYNAVKEAANALANAAAGPLKHSTPKEGPLMHDDVWGMHLAQNFAEAMKAGKPAVKKAAAELAAEANVPAYTDPVSVSGKKSLSDTIKNSISVSPIGGLDPERIYEAVRAGASSITLQIGDRELGRVLRDMGVVFA